MKLLDVTIIVTVDDATDPDAVGEAVFDLLIADNEIEAIETVDGWEVEVLP